MLAPITWAGEYEWVSTVRFDRITHTERPKTGNLLPSYVAWPDVCWFRDRVKSPGKLTGQRVARMVLTIVLRYTFFATVCENNGGNRTSTLKILRIYPLFRAETLTHAVRRFLRLAPHSGLFEPTLAPSFPETAFPIHQAKIRTTRVFANTKAWFLHDRWLLRYRRLKYPREEKGFWSSSSLSNTWSNRWREFLT